MLPKCSHLWGGTRHLPNSPQHPGEGQEVKVSAVQVWAGPRWVVAAGHLGSIWRLAIQEGRFPLWGLAAERCGGIREGWLASEPWKEGSSSRMGHQHKWPRVAPGGAWKAGLVAGALGWYSGDLRPFPALPVLLDGSFPKGKKLALNLSGLQFPVGQRGLLRAPSPLRLV